MSPSGQHHGMENIDGVRSALSNGAKIDRLDNRYVSTNYITTYIPIQ